MKFNDVYAWTLDHCVVSPYGLGNGTLITLKDDEMVLEYDGFRRTISGKDGHIEVTDKGKFEYVVWIFPAVAVKRDKETAYVNGMRLTFSVSTESWVKEGMIFFRMAGKEVKIRMYGLGKNEDK